MRAESRLLLLGLAAMVLVHCAKGSALVGAGGDGGDGEGASSSGGSHSTGGVSDTGGVPGTGGSGAGTTTSDPSTTSTSSSSSSSTTSSSSSSTTSSSSSSTSSSSTTTSSSSTSSSSSSTSSSSSSSTTSTVGGDCDPMNPGAVCLSSEHCFPAEDGVPVCLGPVGGGGNYAACDTPADCQAALECVDTGDIFNSFCCLQWCTSDASCSAGSACYFLSPAVYVGVVEYGVCYDDFGGC